MRNIAFSCAIEVEMGRRMRPPIQSTECASARSRPLFVAVVKASRRVHLHAEPWSTPSLGRTGMSNSMIFKAFFSYAHHDARADPKLVEAITRTLPSHVTSRFVSDTFELWRDTEDLRTGERWDARIEEALRASHVLIVLLTPRWIGSDFCRREYRTFEEVEPGLGTGEY